MNDGLESLVLLKYMINEGWLAPDDDGWKVRDELKGGIRVFVEGRELVLARIKKDGIAICDDTLGFYYRLFVDLRFVSAFGYVRNV